MDIIKENTEMNPFIEESQKSRKNTTCVRFMRKKFQCIIVYTLLLIAFLEVIQIVMDKLNSDTIESLYKKLGKH